MEVEQESLVRVTSIGGMWLRVWRAGTGMVWNALVMRCRPMFWTESRRFRRVSWGQSGWNQTGEV